MSRMIDFNGFDKGVIGKKLPSDTTLNNMRKADLIELLHMADHNHNVLAEAYKIAVDNSKCNTCLLGSKKAEHGQRIRNEVIEEFRNYYQKRYEEEKKMALIFDFTLDILKEFEQMKGETE